MLRCYSPRVPPTSKKIFISWSGPETRPIANTWADLLRDMFDFVEPFVSTAISPGERGLDQIKEALADTQFGVFVTTRANQHAAWLNFEAGAISNQATDTSTAVGKVAPCLVDFVNDTDLTSPLRQFQYRTLNREGVLDILTTIAEANSVDVSRIANRFELAWNAPDTGYSTRFAAAIATVTASAEVDSNADADTAATTPAPTSRNAEDMFSEVLAILRDLQRREASESSYLSSPGRRGVNGLRTINRSGAIGGRMARIDIDPDGGFDPRRRLDPKSEERLAADVRSLLAAYMVTRNGSGLANAEFGYYRDGDGQINVAMKVDAMPEGGYDEIAALVAKHAVKMGWEIIKFLPPGTNFDDRWIPLIEL